MLSDKCNINSYTDAAYLDIWLPIKPNKSFDPNKLQ